MSSVSTKVIPLSKKTKTTGFTLVEVMIAMLVLSFGLLGFASLQVYGVNNTHSAYLRTQATALAYEMSDRMRANSSAIIAGTYNQATSNPKAECNQSSGCSSAELALNDVYEWQKSVAANLPVNKQDNISFRQQSVVCLDSTPKDGIPGTPACDSSGTVYAIKIWWKDDRDPGKNTPNDYQLFVTEFQP